MEDSPNNKTSTFAMKAIVGIFQKQTKRMKREAAEETLQRVSKGPWNAPKAEEKRCTKSLSLQHGEEVCKYQRRPRKMWSVKRYLKKIE